MQIYRLKWRGRWELSRGWVSGPLLESFELYLYKQWRVLMSVGKGLLQQELFKGQVFLKTQSKCSFIFAYRLLRPCLWTLSLTESSIHIISTHCLR